jgi:hypothetical protein
MYLFFSSDAFDLFSRDIISALSLPENYSVHFRYREELLPETADFIANARGRDAMIIYVKGNKLGVDAAELNLQFLPIRSATVIDGFKSESTGLVHIYLKLGEFITWPDRDGQLAGAGDALPPYKYVHFCESIQGTFICQWHEKVKELVRFDERFGDKLFFHLGIREQQSFNRSQVQICFDKAEKWSSFELLEDKQYTLFISIYNSSRNPHDFEKHRIKIDYDTENFFITNPDSIIIGADRDDRSYKIVTKDIKSIESASYLKIQSLFKENADTDVESVSCEEVITLGFKRNPVKMRRLFFLSIGSFLGSALGAYGASQLKPEGNYPILFMVGGLGCFLFSTMGQYYYFKKN